MANFHFDFRQDARRSAIIDQLHAALGNEVFESVLQQAQSAGIPPRHHHNIAELKQTIQQLTVSSHIKEQLFRIYEILARAEACVHNCDIEKTHFHEVGQASHIESTLIMCCALAQLAPEKITATEVQTGQGKVKCAHGLLDIPTPATAAILQTGIPVCEEKLTGELCTPTSAAFIKHVVDEFV